MHKRLTGDEAGLIGYWNFDDGTARDKSKYGNHGRLVGRAAITRLSGIDAIHQEK
jgi:hypothetical protein